MALDIAEARKWLDLCGSCDAGLPMSCTCVEVAKPSEEYL